MNHELEFVRISIIHAPIQFNPEMRFASVLYCIFQMYTLHMLCK